MYKIITITLLLFALTFCARAQVTPADNSALNYRLVGFSFPAVMGMSSYRIEIATGDFSTEESFKKNIITTKESNKNRQVVEVPAFGAKYTWRYLSLIGHDVKSKGELHHFSTATDHSVDTSINRLHVFTPAASDYKDCYVFIDATKTLYDMKGNAVWYIPDIKGAPATAAARDIKPSVWGTITFMIDEKPYEISYNGNIIWQMPGKSETNGTHDKEQNQFHHDFTHLPDGNYIALGMQHTTWDAPARQGKANNAPVSQKITAGRIIEFNKDYKIMWSWNAADYFRNSDLVDAQISKAFPGIGNTHENAICFDEKAKTVYLSFRNLNRIVKISYPDGTVLNTYGQLYQPGIKDLTNGLFCGQHCCRRSQDGYLYLFNNNTCNRLSGHYPTIEMLQEPSSPGGKLKKVWEYECIISDGLTAQQKEKLLFETGGSVFELPDHAIFCCMAGNYDKVFIVNRSKKILWSALAERYSTTEKKWLSGSGYRASIITRQQLENLVWNEPFTN